MKKDKNKPLPKKLSKSVNKVSDQFSGKIVSGLVVIAGTGTSKPGLPKQEKCPK